MKSQVLPILNAIGCLALAAVVIVQWRREHTLHLTRTHLQAELATANEQVSSGKKHASDLERDIAVLKETLIATQQAAETATHTLAEQATQVTTLQTDLAAAREQVKTWQTTLADRDDKLRALSAELIATRQRLDEAITKLKAGSGR